MRVLGFTVRNGVISFGIDLSVYTYLAICSILVVLIPQTIAVNIMIIAIKVVISCHLCMIAMQMFCMKKRIAPFLLMNIATLLMFVIETPIAIEVLVIILFLNEIIEYLYREKISDLKFLPGMKPVWGVVATGTVIAFSTILVTSMNIVFRLF